jgi:uncharacterized protein with HEPN domain
MLHDPDTLLHDMREAAEFILEQTRELTLAEYKENRVVCAAVERKFITIGEAMSRLTRVDPTLARSLGNFPQIIAFRNVIVHGYDIIEDAIVWGVIQNELPRLIDALDKPAEDAS